MGLEGAGLGVSCVLASFPKESALGQVEGSIGGNEGGPIPTLGSAQGRGHGQNYPPCERISTN